MTRTTTFSSLIENRDAHSVQLHTNRDRLRGGSVQELMISLIWGLRVPSTVMCLEQMAHANSLKIWLALEAKKL
jgi:hypothetical protein